MSTPCNSSDKSKKTHFSFTRSYRLLTAVDFDTVFKNRDLVLHNAGFTYLIHQNLIDLYSDKKCVKKPPRIGFVLAKKKIKRAVGRNRVRRQHREIFRQMQHLLPPCDIVVLAKNHADTISRDKLYRMIEKTFLQIPKKLNTPSGKQ